MNKMSLQAWGTEGNVYFRTLLASQMLVNMRASPGEAAKTAEGPLVPKS